MENCSSSLTNVHYLAQRAHLLPFSLVLHWLCFSSSHYTEVSCNRHDLLLSFPLAVNSPY